MAPGYTSPEVESHTLLLSLTFLLWVGVAQVTLVAPQLPAPGTALPVVRSSLLSLPRLPGAPTLLSPAPHHPACCPLSPTAREREQWRTKCTQCEGGLGKATPGQPLLLTPQASVLKGQSLRPHTCIHARTPQTPSVWASLLLG